MGRAASIVGWRTLLACVVGAGIFAIFNLYVLAVVTGWIGRKMGGVASNDAVRAVFAWGMLPSILGTCGRSVDCRRLAHIRAGAEPRLLSSLFDLVNGVCGLWGLVVTLADAVAGRAVRLLADDRDLFCRHAGAGGGPGAHGADFPVSAVQPAGGVHVADLAAGRPCLRGEIPLWLHPLFAAVLAAAVFGAHLRLRSRARRCDRLPPAKGYSRPITSSASWGFPAIAFR